ncbi:LON peptidase substrate-binding domain-containing protein [bacterium]|nr:LON peptidase substrate-binding domain-containing protein [bacterium]
MNHQIVPLFPLPGLVLFPRTTIPLHFFEPRYVKMIQDAIAGERRVATAQLRRGWEQNYFGRPPVFRTVTIARILFEEEPDDGGFDVLLEGIERAAVVQELKGRPYRRAKVVSLVDLMPEADRTGIDEATAHLVRNAERLAALRPNLRHSLTNLENTHLHPGIIADQVASVLIKDAYDRQSILEERRVLRRLQLVNVQLRATIEQERNASSRQHETQREE